MCTRKRLKCILMYQRWKDRNQFHKVEVLNTWTSPATYIPFKMIPTMGSLTRHIIDLLVFFFSINIFSRWLRQAYNLKMQLELGNEPFTCPQHKPSAYLLSTFSINRSVANQRSLNILKCNFGPVWILVQWILVQSMTIRRTDRKRYIWAHHAYAQVCSKRIVIS